MTQTYQLEISLFLFVWICTHCLFSLPSFSAFSFALLISHISPSLVPLHSFVFFRTLSLTSLPALSFILSLSLFLLVFLHLCLSMYVLKEITFARFLKTTEKIWRKDKMNANEILLCSWCREICWKWSNTLLQLSPSIY